MKKKKQRACTSCSMEYQARGAGIVTIPLKPRQARYVMTRLGLSRNRIKKELTRLFRYGKVVKTRGTIIQPIFDREN